MSAITKRELNQRTAQVLEAVDRGGPVTITERGVPRWRIEAIDPSADPVAMLRAQGRTKPAKAEPAPWLRQDLDGDPARIDALLRESRGEH